MTPHGISASGNCGTVTSARLLTCPLDSLGIPALDDCRPVDLELESVQTWVAYVAAVVTENPVYFPYAVAHLCSGQRLAVPLEPEHRIEHAIESVTSLLRDLIRTA